VESVVEAERPEIDGWFGDAIRNSNSRTSFVDLLARASRRATSYSERRTPCL
jgi:hypothetical protein